MKLFNGNIRPSFFLSAGLSKEKQRRIMARFRDGYHKCLVATAVAIEGINIPECSLNIKYRLNLSEIVQHQVIGICFWGGRWGFFSKAIKESYPTEGIIYVSGKQGDE